MKFLCLTFLFTFLCHYLVDAQAFVLTDGRDNHPNCAVWWQVWHTKPKEVLFGVMVQSDHSVWVACTSKEWLLKLLNQKTDGLAVDLVTKDQFACGKTKPSNLQYRQGYMLPPVYSPQLRTDMKQFAANGFSMRVGEVPTKLRGQMIEGRLIMIKNRTVCHVLSSINIDRSLWALLGMGLFADTYLEASNFEADTTKTSGFFYTKRLQFVVPFAKNQTQASIKPLYDSLRLAQYQIAKVAIRAYSSVEGSEAQNLALQRQRAQAIVKALQPTQAAGVAPEITTAENWVEFLRDVAATPHAHLAQLPKAEVKLKLQDAKLLASLEPKLRQHRKAVVTVYLRDKTGQESTATQAMPNQFQAAIAKRDVQRALAIQREIFDRVSDNRMPTSTLQELEIPSEKLFSPLLNNQGIYEYLLGLQAESEALAFLLPLAKLDPTNGKLAYNICALRLRLWQLGDLPPDRAALLAEINLPTAWPIPPSAKCCSTQWRSTRNGSAAFSILPILGGQVFSCSRCRFWTGSIATIVRSIDQTARVYLG
jgi:hypothetical protein